MNYSMVLYILGYILQFESAFLMLPALVSLIYQEEGQAFRLSLPLQSVWF